MAQPGGQPRLAAVRSEFHRSSPRRSFCEGLRQHRPREQSRRCGRRCPPCSRRHRRETPGRTPGSSRYGTCSREKGRPAPACLLPGLPGASSHPAGDRDTWREWPQSAREDPEIAGPHRHSHGPATSSAGARRWARPPRFTLAGELSPLRERHEQGRSQRTQGATLVQTARVIPVTLVFYFLIFLKSYHWSPLFFPLKGVLNNQRCILLSLLS